MAPIFELIKEPSMTPKPVKMPRAMQETMGWFRMARNHE